MAMGTRKSEQTPMWVPTSELPVSPGHPFYAKLNTILDGAGRRATHAAGLLPSKFGSGMSRPRSTSTA